jgi:putative toxin-antitoxin system antitoxin component (TIGR02293 family)
MSGRLRTYDGAVNGIDVLRGLVVAKAGTAQPIAETKAAQPTKLAPTPERLSKQSVLERVLERATEVIGTREEALRWLGKPVRALDYVTPISLLLDDAGADQVLGVLTNLENGVL